MTNNTKSLQLLDKQLLERLSNSSGNLLDDIELIEVLANTKAKAKEVEQKLMDAEEKKVGLLAPNDLLQDAFCLRLRSTKSENSTGQ